MKRYFFISLIMLFSISLSCKAQSEAYVHKQTELKFARAIQGVPLVVPLPEESDPILFLMPVSENDTIPVVDALYLVDNTRREFSFERDIYNVCRIEITGETPKAVVYNVFDGSEHEFEIDSFMLHTIIRINKGKWRQYSSHVTIPIITKEKENPYKPHRAEK